MPTFGRAPKSGCAPLGYSLDHVGPLARSAWDCAAMLQSLAGFDESDPDSADRPVPDYLSALRTDLRGVRVGVLREHHLEQCEPAVAAAFETAVGVVRDLGADVREITVPLYQEMIAASLVTMVAEAAAYHHGDLARRWTDYTKGLTSLVGWGVLFSASDYVQAQRVRRVGQRKLAEVFANL